MAENAGISAPWRAIASQAYPKQARRTDAQGAVTLAIRIGADGTVRSCSVARQCGIGALAAIGNLAAQCGSLVILTLLAGLPQGLA